MKKKFTVMTNIMNGRTLFNDQRDETILESKSAVGTPTYDQTTTPSVPATRVIGTESIPYL